MRTINLKSVGKGVAIGLLAILGYTGVDMGVDKIQLSIAEYNATRNYLAMQCWKGNPIQWGEVGLMADIFTHEISKTGGSVSISNFDKETGLKKLCKQMIKL